MSKKNEIFKEIINYIESSVHEGFEESELIKTFRKLIEKYIEERIE